MAEESCSAEVVVVPKFDMQCYESKMTAKDVILLAQKYIVPLDFHPSAPTEGWMMNQLPPEVIGLYEQFFEFSGLSLGISPTVSLFRVFYKISKQGHWFSFEKRVGKNVGDQRAVPDAMAWRHHDSDVYDAFPDSDFSRQDIGTLTERIIDLRPVPHGLVFAVGLATTWDFPGFFPIFKDTGGNALLLERSPSPPNHPEKKRSQAARADAKKKENKRANDEGGSSRLKRQRVSAKPKGSTTSSGHVSSPYSFRLFLFSGKPDRHVDTGHMTESQKSRCRNIEEGKSSRGASMYVPQWVIPLRLGCPNPIAAQIQSLEAELARKDSALTYTKRMLAEGARDREKLTDQLGQAEIEKFDCI
ncbi:hypothetical protein Tco_0985312 [Tanacetum coccineum]